MKDKSDKMKRTRKECRDSFDYEEVVYSIKNRTTIRGFLSSLHRTIHKACGRKPTIKILKHDVEGKDFESWIIFIQIPGYVPCFQGLLYKSANTISLGSKAGSLYWRMTETYRKGIHPIQGAPHGKVFVP